MEDASQDLEHMTTAHFYVQHSRQMVKVPLEDALSFKRHIKLHNFVEDVPVGVCRRQRSASDGGEARLVEQRRRRLGRRWGAYTCKLWRKHYCSRRHFWSRSNVWGPLSSLDYQREARECLSNVFPYEWFWLHAWTLCGQAKGTGAQQRRRNHATVRWNRVITQVFVKRASIY